MLLIVMIPSVKRGQTIGKRLRGIRVVSINGADASFGQLLIRYGLPIVVAVSTAPFLPSIGALLALFGVLLWPRNKNRQGIHDRVAKTRVIQDRPALADPTDPLG
jgi:uncharacterized RDD family membrane protein YckC